ncbi:unnamed protein product [Porites lobata]|uniref:Protein kinase domain-containing protein n=1 Tax=Porites lobata TaxID=104759 RepID=A0ABN8R170_9CNID|nr:unnamed protein product [Porites lobata]
MQDLREANSTSRPSELERQLRDFQRQLRDAQQREENLQRQFRELQEREQSSHRQLTESRQREQNLQRQLRELQEREQGSQRQLTESRQQQEQNSQRQLTEFQRQLRNCQEQVSELQLSLSTAQLTINQLRSQETRDWVIPRDEIQITEKCLGMGGWGNVNEGTYCGCTVAVKQIHELILSPHNIHLFEREMNIASKCRHPHLLQFIGATKDEGIPLLVTELMEKSLRTLLEQRQLSETEVAVISLDVALALNYLHQKKPESIIHRDVSSANVLLWRQGDQWRGKVSDYGTANVIQQTMTVAPGAMIYSAPEALTSNQTVKCLVRISHRSVSARTTFVKKYRSYHKSTGASAAFMVLIMFLCFVFRRLSLVNRERRGHLTTDDQLIFFFLIQICQSCVGLKNKSPLLVPYRPVLSLYKLLRAPTAVLRAQILPSSTLLSF